MPNRKVKGPSGRVIEAAPGEYELLKSLGYRDEEPEEATSRIQERVTEEHFDRPLAKISAVGSGIVSGATLGLSDFALTEEGREEALRNPGYRVAGEIVGGLVGTKLPFSPAAAAVKAGGAITKKLGGGVIAKGVGAAAEGAAFGTGASVAQAQLTGEPFTVETFAAGAGIGSLLGFGAGLAGGALEKSALKRSGRAADDVVRDLEKEERIAHLEAKASQLDNPATADRTVIPRENWERVRNSAREVGDELKEIHQSARVALDQVKAAGSFADSVAKADYRTIPGMGIQAGSEIHQAARQLDKAMTTFLAGKGGADLVQGAAVDFFRLVDESKAAGFIFPQGPATMGRDLVAGALDAVERAKVSGDVAHLLRGLPSDAAKMTRTQAEKFAAAVQTAGGLSDNVAGLTDSVDEFLKSIGTSRDGNLAERLYGGFEDLRAGTQQARSAARAVKENAPAVKAQRAAIQAELKKLKSDAVTATKHERHPIKGFLHRLEHYAGTVGGGRIGRRLLGPGGGFAGAVLGGATISTVMSGDAKSGALAGIALGARGRVSALLNRAVSRWGVMGGRTIRRGIPAYTTILSATALSPSPRETRDLRESVKDRAEEVATLMPALPSSAYAATAWLGDEHPEFARAAQEHIQRAIAYLHTMAPRNPGTVIVGGKDRWLPSEIKAREYADRWLGVMMPLEAGEAFLRGEASSATIHALAATNPSYYDYLRKQMIMQVSDPKVMARLDKHARSQVTWFTGVPMDSSERPEIVEFLQQQLTAPPQTGPVPPQPQASLGGRPPGPAQESMTQAQRLTAR